MTILITEVYLFLQYILLNAYLFERFPTDCNILKRNSSA